MPRALGQIDVRKHEAILDAAVEVLAERGVHAPIEEVARRAGVSKQTIYNHYGSKTELVRTLVERRRSRITTPLDRAAPGDRVEDTLTSYAQAILELIVSPNSIQLLRMGVTSASEMPDLARTIYDAGTRASRRRLAEFLASASRTEVVVDDPVQAADVFLGIVTGGVQIRLLLGLETEIPQEDIPARARDCAHRFVRAYAP
ncbi:TetR/AcrR family transcriptional regulator [Caulobacter sp. S45]|uniref:TetR/AcrR family transcriptional regulator n=1 Tax=Caulobacter sp. S45 TaxID=1641861 RepID=UPI00131AD517|nr:TetR/AcrR family transcriptional regulator [Caulobacter sp. S45]